MGLQPIPFNHSGTRPVLKVLDALCVLIKLRLLHGAKCVEHKSE